LLLGNVATQSGQRLNWDRANMKVANTNEDFTKKFISPERRKGWEL